MTELSAKILENWSQVQVANSLEDAIAADYQAGKNLIVLPRPELRAQVDFNALTAQLIDLFSIEPGAKKNMSPTAILNARENLDEQCKRAADILINDYNSLVPYLQHGDLIKLRIQGSEYHSSDEFWHHDGGSSKRLGIRYSGPPTEEAHNDDVIRFRGRGDYCTVNDNPRILTLGAGDVWAHQGTGAIAFKFSRSFPYVKRKKPAVHRKGASNGQPGLLLVADYL